MPHPEATPDRDEPMIVHAHATPWGFLLALPFALALAFFGASLIDADVARHPLAPLGEQTISALGLLVIGFSLYLFLVGVGELAGYLKPAVLLSLDKQGIAVFGLLGERRLAWSDLLQVRIRNHDLIIRGLARTRPGRRTLRLPLARLAIDPRILLRQMQRHRPDLALRIAG